MYYLGIDVGGTKTKAVLLKGFSIKTMECFVIDTPKNKKQFLSVMVRLVRFIAEKKKLSGIGVGLPGIVDVKRGILVKAPNLPFLNGWNAKKFFRKFSSAVAIDNDSRCFVRAEAAYGAARDYKNIIGVAIGTGIGGGVIIDGRMHYGSHNGAGEFGHMMLQIQNSKIKNQNDNSKFKNYEWEMLIGKRAYEQYGDRSEIVAIGIANLMNAFDPDIVVLGGGGITSGAVRIATVRKTAKKYVMSPFEKNIKIAKGELGDFAQAIGAALLTRRP
ncbi:ROK family protein [Patescibacteria group bacterium]|nr:ROK family protein [Patescibacteria group bacterium]